MTEVTSMLKLIEARARATKSNRTAPPQTVLPVHSMISEVFIGWESKSGPVRTYRDNLSWNQAEEQDLRS